MSDTKLNYFNDEDIIHVLISEEEEAKSVEIEPNITAELNDKGELIGIEILKASDFLQSFILQIATEKNLEISKVASSNHAISSESVAFEEAVSGR